MAEVGVEVSALELNVSCPNVAHGGMAFGTDAKVLESLTNQVKRVVGDVPLCVKLTPNVTDITEVARGAEAGGADGLSLINTVLGLHIDIRTGQPVLGNGMGGCSGTAVKPLAVPDGLPSGPRLTKLPIIGMGGIETAADVLEFMMAGASAVAVGAAHFKNAISRLPQRCRSTSGLNGRAGGSTFGGVKENLTVHKWAGRARALPAHFFLF